MKLVFDHLSIQCADVGASAAFYDRVLSAVGVKRVLDFGDVIGYGTSAGAGFWLGPRSTGEGFRETHIAFSAPDRATVRAFFERATDAGAEVLHAPTLWPQYDPDYYAVFVRDPDGNNVEAVCRLPE
jgi:catechol 2,3-dioxygenase-like lactoylglutathione lyase family enzyme